MKKTAGTLLFLAALYLYGYRMKQREAAHPFCREWHTEEETLLIRHSGVVSIQGMQMKVFGYISSCHEVEADVWNFSVRLRKHGGSLYFRYADDALQQLSGDGDILHTYRER